MVTVTTNIDPEIYYTKEFYELRRTRTLSAVINNLLRQHLGIKETEIDTELAKLQEEQTRIESRKTALLAEKESKARAKAVEASKWRELV